MDGLTTTCSAGGRFLLVSPPSIPSMKQANNFAVFPLNRRRSSPIYASSSSSSDGPSPELDKWDQMELKFGKLIGEDPKLTLAKIMGRKSNPNASYLEIEKSFNKRKKGGGEIVEIPLDWAVGKQNQQQQQQRQSSLVGLRAPTHGKKNFPSDAKLNLTRPVDKKEFKDAKVEEKPEPVTNRVSEFKGAKLEAKPAPVTNSVGAGFALRKPEIMQGDDIELEKPSRLQIKPNLFLKMRKGNAGKDASVEVNLLKRPEIMKISLGSPTEKTVISGGNVFVAMSNEESTAENEMVSSALESENMIKTGFYGLSQGDDDGFVLGSTLLHDEIEQSDLERYQEKDSNSGSLGVNSIQDHENASVSASLQGKPQRLGSVPKEISNPAGEETLASNNAIRKDTMEDFLVSAEREELEDGDWRRAEDLFQTGEREEVELVSGSSRGFVVSFGSLIGFLPYRNLVAKWKFLAFESWLRKKGLDPSLYRQNLSIVGNYAVPNKDLSLALLESEDHEKKDEERLRPEMKFQDLLKIYDEEKTKFLCSFVGQRTRVTVVMVDRKSRRLIFSGRPKEKEEMIEKKRSLMAKLSVGDIVKCCIKKITYFGIFVEIEGVPALIHQSEVSWDVALDPSSFFKIGQMVDAKVHQLDYALERITLSLKEIMPDPLNEALESVVGERAPLDASIEASQGDVEWSDVESLINELEQIDGVISVSKGRFFLSPGLAPTFQVYMASMYESRYKLLARFENKVQEVIVHASLDKNQMKGAILNCTNRVE